jgi:hypothetical protein
LHPVELRFMPKIRIYTIPTDDANYEEHQGRSD